MKADDKIAEFGSVTAANFTGLKNVADVVQHSVGVRRALQRAKLVSIATP